MWGEGGVIGLKLSTGHSLLAGFTRVVKGMAYSPPPAASRRTMPWLGGCGTPTNSYVVLSWKQGERRGPIDQINNEGAHRV